MWRPAAFDLLIVLAAVALGGALTVAQSQGLPELLFYAVLLTLLGIVGRVVVTAWQAARTERARATELAATAPEAVALAAVHEERLRLETDIAATLREALVRVRAAAAEAALAPDPSAPVRRIHNESQVATSELRRHLGLLREPPGVPAPPAPQRERTPRGDLVLAVAVSILAAFESAAYSITEGPADWSWWSVLLSTLAAATVAGRTVALPVAALVCGACYVLGALTGVPVVNGFWSIGSVGVLAWTVAARPRTSRRDMAGGVVLVTAVGASGWVADRDNVGILLVILAVAVVAGLVVRYGRRRAADASKAASAREEELRSAARVAVQAERGVVARDLHDVVSHAVGLIAVQAAAAEVSWPKDADAVRRSIALIDATAATALAELGRLRPDEPAARSMSDVGALVARIRAAGTAVDLTVVGEPPPEHVPVVYRIAQESLTNVVRHAPGARVTVAIRSDDRQTVVRVVDDGTPRDVGAAGRGFGLVGLAERVAFAGGSLQSGGGPGGGFRVEAVLPVRADAVTT